MPSQIELLPTETEFIDREYYICASEDSPIVRRGRVIQSYPELQDLQWLRLAPVARYQPPAPEVAEPTGLGAVVRDANGLLFISSSSTTWILAIDRRDPFTWADIKRPGTVEILSEGVVL